MRYNFQRLSGEQWCLLIDQLKTRGSEFIEVNKDDLYIRDKVYNVYNAYFYRNVTCCKIIYYTWKDNRWKKNLKEISFSPRDINPVYCVATFQKIAKKYNELLPYEDTKVFDNGVYTYFARPYKGYCTALDMNSAYLYALTQPLADYTTRVEVNPMDVGKREYDYYSVENSLLREMYHKDDDELKSALLRADIRVFGYKAKRHFIKTAEELYRLKCEVNKEKYKNVANIYVGCMHKHNGKRNNATLAASLYAWFANYIQKLVKKFNAKGYEVVSLSTDCVKIKGKYNIEDNVVTIGNGLGEFKIEYEGEAEYISQGHYVEDKIKWKGRPQYLIKGYKKCNFIDISEEERRIYEEFAIT